MFYVKRPFFPRKTALFNSNDQELCRISGMSFGCFSRNLRKKQAPHDLQTYILSGENDLLHDVHFIIITALS